MRKRLQSCNNSYLSTTGINNVGKKEKMSVAELSVRSQKVKFEL